MIKKLIYIFTLSFAINWIWENLHSVLYVHPDGTPITNTMLLNATLFDAVFITLMAIIFFKIDYFKERAYWAVIFGVLVAIFIEIRALDAGRWAYTSAMPIIPLIGTGLTPTIQLGLISYIVYKIIKR